MAENHRSRVRWHAAALVAAAGLAVGCQATPTPGATEIQPGYDAATGKLERLTYDRNHDGDPDAWLFLKEGSPERAELDDNYDGRAERWEYYEPSPPDAPTVRLGGPFPRGVLVRAEQDLHGDGRISRRETYTAGVLSAVEEDTTGDGRPDKWEEWSAGDLVTVSLDTRNAGRPDRRLVYGAGEPPRLELDEDGDGQFTPATSTP